MMKCWAWLGLAALVAACDPGALRAPDEPVNWVVDGPLADATDELGVTPPVEPGLPFNRVALRWDAPEDISFQARARAADGTWGPWTPVERTWSEEGMHVGRAELPADSRAWQLQVAPAEAAERVSFIEAEVLTGELETPPEETYDPAEEATPLPDLGELIDLDLDEPLEVEGVPEDGFEQFIEKSRPAIVSRASWGARAPRCSYGSHRPNRLTIHHTVTPNNDAMSAPARVRQIQAFHQSGRGWCDIGYHFLVARDGRVFQGRPHDRLGAHVANANSGNVGISFLGTYTSANPTAAQLRSAAAVVRWIATSYNISRDRTHVKGHRQYGGTSCPGDRLYARLPDIVRMSRQADGGGNAGGGGGNAAPAPQDGVLTGIIHVNGDTDRRIAGATVRLGDRSMRTGADGLYRFRVPPGRYSVRVSKDGWQAGTSSTQDVRSGHTRWASVGLRRPPAAQPTGSLGGGGVQAPDDTRRQATAPRRPAHRQPRRRRLPGPRRHPPPGQRHRPPVHRADRPHQRPRRVPRHRPRRRRPHHGHQDRVPRGQRHPHRAPRRRDLGQRRPAAAVASAGIAAGPPSGASSRNAWKNAESSPMAENKTQPTDASVDAFIDALPDARKQADARWLLAQMSALSGEPAVMWGPTLVGFGRYHYRYESGREGDFFRVGFSPRKASLVVYIMPGFDAYDGLLARLGRHKTGSSCLYITRLDAIDREVLTSLIAASLAAMDARYPREA